MARKHRITIELDEFGWRALSDEAGRQKVTVEELLVHAAMYYLSDLDTGRVAARVLKEIEEGEEPPGEGRPRRRFGTPSDQPEPGEEDEG